MCFDLEKSYIVDPYAGNPINREDGHHRTTTKRHEQETKEKKERKQDLTRFGNLPTSSGQGREFLLNQSITCYKFQDTNIGDATSPYIAKEATKKRKPKTLNSDQN